jgi:predicted aminopeptidase
MLAALAVSVLPGCGTLYVAQAAIGQWHVLHARRPIPAVVEDPHTPSTVRDTLSVVREARDFASSDLHLPDNKSYRTYADIHRRYVVWNVVATPEFSVGPKRWCFPIAGCVAYRGYFKEKKATAFADGLSKQGYDVMVGGVTAYSTLGKFADPVLSSMIGYGDMDLTATIFHELAHQLLYVQNDSEFNEAFATTVEDEGLRRWLEKRGNSGAMATFLESHEHEHEFVQLFTSYRAKLARLYASKIARDQMRADKQKSFASLADDIKALEKRQGVRYGLYERWIANGLNNADLASVATYYDCVPGFERLFAEQGGDFQRFYAAAREMSKLTRAERHAKLCVKPQ